MNKDKYVFAQLVEFLTNATHISSLLVSIVKHDMQLDRSIYEVLQILSISLTDKTRLKDLFDKNFNMTKNFSALMSSQFYLMFNLSLIFMGH